MIPAAVISPAKFRARCSLCDVEVTSSRAWREHVAGPGHALAVAGRQASLQEQLDKELAEMERHAKRLQLIIRAITLFNSEKSP